MWRGVKLSGWVWREFILVMKVRNFVSEGREVQLKADTGKHVRASIRVRLSLVHFDSLSVI